MSKLPQPFWAIVLAAFGCLIGLCCLFVPNKDASVTMGVLALASNLISGALGGFAAAHPSTKPDVTMGNGQATIISSDTK